MNMFMENIGVIFFDLEICGRQTSFKAEATTTTAWNKYTGHVSFTQLYSFIAVYMSHGQNG
jgi:hypothetical protein